MVSISVVVPSGPDAALLRITLDAIATQTRRPDEVIVVAETAESARIAAAAGVRIVESQRGVAAMLAGFDAANCDALAHILAGTAPGRHWIAQLEVDFDADDTALIATVPASERRPLLRAVLGSLAVGAVSHGAFTVAGHPAVLGAGFGVRADVWRRVRGRLHTDRADLDPALDLAFQIAPDMRVLLDPTLTLRVPASADPFAFAARAVRTIDVNRRERSALRRRWRRYAGSQRPTLEITGTRRIVEEAEHVAGRLLWGRLVRDLRRRGRPAVPLAVAATPAVESDSASRPV